MKYIARKLLFTQYNDAVQHYYIVILHSKQKKKCNLIMHKLYLRILILLLYKFII